MFQTSVHVASLQPLGNSCSIHPSLSLFDHDPPTVSLSSSSSNRRTALTFSTSPRSSSSIRLNPSTPLTGGPTTTTTSTRTTSRYAAAAAAATPTKRTSPPRVQLSSSSSNSTVIPAPSSTALPALPTFIATRSLPRFPCPSSIVHSVENWGDELRKREESRSNVGEGGLGGGRRARRRRAARFGRTTAPAEEEEEEDDRWEVASDVTVTASDLVARAELDAATTATATRPTSPRRRRRRGEESRGRSFVNEDEERGGLTPTQEYSQGQRELR